MEKKRKRAEHEIMKECPEDDKWFPTFVDPIVVHSKATNILEIERMVAVEMKSSYCGVLLPMLSSELPLPPGMSHAKRVRKVDGGQRVQVLLEPCHNLDHASSESCGPKSIVVTEEAKRILCKLSDAIGNVEYNFSIKEVPSKGPTDAGVLAAWTREYWPVSIRAPDKMGKREGEELNIEDIKSMKQHMVNVWRLSKASKKHGGGCNACIIVNPLTNTVVGSGVDTSQHHPLQHPVLNAIQEVAAWQISRWYQDLIDDRLDMKSMPSRSNMHSILQLETALDCPENKAGDCDHPPYLCTGYDCYVFREPCAMCAMALVHSRLRRIVFCRGDTSGGMLGGSGVRLHSLKSLNHHFVVYHMPMT